MAIIQGHAKSSGVTAGFYPTTINQSLRFEDGDSAYLSRTFTASNRKTYTWSGWIKRGQVTGLARIFSGYNISSYYAALSFESTEKLDLLIYNGGITGRLLTTQVFRDPSAWYHIVAAVDTTQAIPSDRMKLYVNGVQITDFDTETYPALNTEGEINNAKPHYLGRLTGTGDFDGYMAEVHFTDGTAYTADDFGELKSGIWVPKADVSTTVTYGTNGFYLDFADGAAIGDDESGNTNDWTATNLVASDVVLDSPTNTFCTLNSVEFVNNSGFLSEGNLKISDTSSSNLSASGGTIGMKSGKWYWEAHLIVQENGFNIGVVKDTESATSGTWNYTKTNFYAINGLGTSYVSDGAGAQNAAGTSFAQGDTVQVAYDADTGKLYFGKNGTWLNSADPAAGTGNLETTSDPEYGYHPVTSTIGDASGYSDVIMNFGQDDTFAGNLTTVGNTDGNGIGSFKYTVPSGFLALCTANLPDPVIDPAQEATADQHFNVYTYVGNGASQLIGDVVREIPDTVTINQSLRFDHAGSTYLTFDPASDGDKTEWTFSTWFKRTGADARMIFGQGTNGSNNRDIIYLEATGELQVASYGGSYVFQFVTDRIFNDSAAWYHLVVAYDSSQATDTDRVKIWVNGLLITNFSTNNKPALNASTAHFNSGSPQYIGRYIDQGTHWNGYQAETHWIDGTAYAATDFGAYNADGIWTPITPSVTYGTNGWHIDYSAASYTDNVSDPDTFADQANSNDFSAYGIEAEDIFPDTPTNQFAVLDSNRKPAHVTLTEGNLVSAISTIGWETFKSAIGFKKGKWYWEIKLADDGRQFVGIMHESSDAVDIADVYWRTGLWNVYYNGNMYLNSGTTVSNGNTFGGDDIMSIAFDADTGQFWLGENGTWYNSGDPANGTNELFTIPTTERMFPTGSVYYAASRQRWNFGADATFAGDDTGSAGPYSDDNSVGEFYYQPPTGFLAICENNLLPYDDNPLESPDFVWIKNREQADAHQWYDSVRGIYQDLHSDLASVESTTVTGLTGFHKNGFTIGDNVAVNTSGEDYVAWAWKAGTSVSGSTTGLGTSKSYTGSVNTDAGFSIIAYEGNGTAGHTIPHHLDSTPEMLIVKERTNDGGWWSVYHKDSTATGTAADTYIQLDQAGASASWNGWDDTAPTASVFSLGSYDDVNGSTDTYIAYCFHSVDGFSKVGSYVGNGNADGTFVYTGFRPKWIMVKSTTNVSSPYMGWCIIDAETMSFNADEQGTQLWANAAYIQGTRGNGSADATVGNFDLLSNGFKLRTNLVEVNYTGQQYIYLAFAEQPFKYSNAR